MSDFDAIDALLAASGPEAELPPVAERRALREALHLSQAQVARAIGVSPTTVGGWESGREPTGEIRDKYAYFLGAARERTEPEAEPERESSDGSATDVADADAHSSADSEAVPLARPEPCVLCGRPATEQVEGFPQHLDPAQCAPATPAPEPTRPTPAQDARLGPGERDGFAVGRGVRIG
ncbi:helix-turn-helix transcriptional regulator, partial [Streptomyces kanamyceticus]|uniref:helix-turn-helix transcriptional regulator n=1 Tax=Streptomyces kanamyceticus TaxID=1967 RepID=UPI0012FEB286